MSIFKEIFKYLITDQKEEIELQNEIDLKEKQLERYAEHFDGYGNVKCEYCDVWIDVEYIGKKCPICDAYIPHYDWRKENENGN